MSNQSSPPEVLNARESTALEVFGLTLEKLELLKRTIARGCDNDEFELFLHVCKTRKADPFSKLIYPVKRWDSKLQREVMQLQSSIDYFRLTAERTGKYAGQLGPQWCGKDGQWLDVWLDDKPPAASRVGVLRKDFAEPLWTVALWSNYVQTTKDGRPTSFWARMGPLMLAKCAEALSLRRAFPEDLAGLYTADEMEQATVVDVPVEVKQAEPPKALPPAGNGKKKSKLDAAVEKIIETPGLVRAEAIADELAARHAQREAEMAEHGREITVPAEQEEFLRKRKQEQAAEQLNRELGQPGAETRTWTCRWEASPERTFEVPIQVAQGMWNTWADEKLPAGTLSAKGAKTWRELSRGSRDGYRHKMLAQAVVWAANNPSEYGEHHERCACALAVMEWLLDHPAEKGTPAKTEPTKEDMKRKSADPLAQGSLYQ